MRKLIILGFILFGALSFALPTTASAVDVLQDVCRQNASADVCQDNNTNGQNPIYGPSGILTSLTRILSIVLGVVAVITIIIAGLKMITSGGDSSGVSTARRALIYAVIGLFVAAIAQALVVFVLSRV